MAKYIDCDAAIALAKDIIVPTKSGYDYLHRCIDPQDLAELPAADVVERKTGKWMLPNNEVAVYLNEWICSACNYLIDGKHNFCPNCGAQMIGGDDDV